MNKRRRVALVVAGAAALSLSSVVATAGPPSTAVRTIAGSPSGLLGYAPGEPVAVPTGFSTAGLHSLLSFVQMTDVHVTDEESPGRLEFLDGIDPFGGAYRPNESLSTQTLEATVERVRDSVSPVTHAHPQFTMVTGDMADSQQYNEARWLIDILDGNQTVTPDSGVYSGSPTHLYDGVQAGSFYDPDGNGDAASPYAGLRDFRGLFEAAQQPFYAEGLGMPWYATFGNHDALIQGNAPIAYVGPGGRGPDGTPFPLGSEIANPYIQSVVTGGDKLTAFPPKPPTLTPFQWAAYNLQQLFTDPIGYLAAAKADGRTKAVPADPARCYLAKDTPTWTSPVPAGLPCRTTSWVNELSRTTGSPVGHGMVPAAADGGYGRPSTAVANHDGYYSFSPADGFRMVVLDTDTDFCATGLCDFGSLDSAQFAWLDAQLQAASDAGQHVVIFSHHPLVGTDSVIDPGPSQDPTETWKSSADVQAELCRYPAVLATVSGHTHHNHVDDVACGAGAASGGFVGINTTSEMDYPAQARLIEIVQNAKGQLALALTMIDNQSPPMVGSGSAYDGPLALASIAREIGYRSDSAGSRAAAVGTPSDRNILVPLSR